MPNTIAQNLQRLIDAKSAIATAITNKGGTVGVSDGLEDFAADIATIPSGGGGESYVYEDVRFIDYDGTITNGYSAAEFAELEALPSNTSHDGMTAKGWTSTLADAKAYVSTYGKMDIGQLYEMTDDKTRIKVVINDARKSPIFGIGVNGSVDIDWGDGSEHTTLTGSSASTYVYTDVHSYQSGGEYTITLTVTGSAAFVSQNSVCAIITDSSRTAANSYCYANYIKEIFIGDNITYIRSDSLHNCYSLRNVAGVGKNIDIRSGAFRNCSAMMGYVIPNNIDGLSDEAFHSCNSLRSIVIPDSITAIGESTFKYCYALDRVTLPSSLLSIGASAFYNCYSLCDVVIPNSVTSIGASAFYGCNSLPCITIPDSVTSIGANALQNCYSLGYVKFEAETPPTAGGAFFQNVPTSCTIYVPEGTLSAYTSADNYPDSSTYNYVEY